MNISDSRKWLECISEMKHLAQKYGGAFDLSLRGNGKERVSVEIWFNQQTNSQQTKGEKQNDTQS